MPEIIVRGVKPDERKYKLTCSNCSSVIVFKKHEGNVSRQYNESCILFTCPVCNKSLSAELNDYMKEPKVGDYYNK